MKQTIALLLFISPLLAIAQTGTTSSATSTEQAVVSATPASTTAQGSTGFAVASINLTNATATKTGTSTYFVNFLLFNNGETQKGIYYMLALTENDGDVVVTQNFDKELTLEKNKPLPISETFVVPKGLKGTYGLQVRAITETGLVVGFGSAGTIEAKDTELLTLASCVPDEKTYELTQVLKINCTIRELKKGILSSLETGGYVVAAKVFYENEPREFSNALAEIKGGKAEISLPGLVTPGTFTIRLTIKERGGTLLGKETSLIFTVNGVRVTILNALLNKDIFQKGDEALGAAAFKIKTVGTSTSFTVSQSISGTKGPCASPKTETLGNKSSIQMTLPIVLDCINPSLYVEVSNDKNVVLASTTVSYTSPVREDALKQPSPSVTAQDKMIYGGVGGLGLLIGLLSVYIARRRLVNNVTP